MLSLSTSASRSNSSSLAYEGGTKGALMMVLSYIQGTSDFSGATYIPTYCGGTPSPHSQLGMCRHRCSGRRCPCSNTSPRSPQARLPCAPSPPRSRRPPTQHPWGIHLGVWRECEEGEEKVGSVRSWKEVCLVTGRRHIIAPTDHATAHERRTERAVAAGIPHILLLDTLMALAP